jgi:anion-transporting  ArsA/GET3 family ATPase
MRRPLAQVVLVTGKGGVGKTTVAAALALAEAEAGRRAALVEIGDGESGARVLGDALARFGGSGRRALDHVVLEPTEAL